MSSGYRIGYVRAVAGFDAVFVGSGINALAGAALLSKAGWNVCVLERSDELGGCIRTSSDLTVPGFTHEVLASWHPLFTGSPAYAELKPDLDRRGLEYLNTELPTGSAYPGRLGCLPHDVARGQRRRARAPRRRGRPGLGGDVQRRSWRTPTCRSACSAPSSGRPPASASGGRRSAASGVAGCSSTSAVCSTSCRDWLGDTFESDAAHGLLAPWVLHTGLGPDQATSGFMTQVIACALQLGGMPVPKGGGVVLVDGLAGIVRDAGGEVRTGVEVERVLVSGGKATAVRLAAARRSARSARSSRASRRRSSTGDSSARATFPPA